MSLFDKMLESSDAKLVVNPNVPQPPAKTKKGKAKAPDQPVPAGMTVAQVLAAHGGAGVNQPIQPVSQQTRFSASRGVTKVKGKAAQKAMRPEKLDDFMGQDKLKDGLRKKISASLKNNRPLRHTLIAAKAGQGKTTLGRIIGHEMQVNTHELQCPVHSDRLLQLSTQMRDGDILLLDEVHLQARSRNPQSGAEVLYNIMEDGMLIGPLGPVQFPLVTLVGATTDEGLLPPSFRDRFPTKALFADYGLADLMEIAKLNANQLGLDIDADAMLVLANASRGIPREINSFMAIASDYADSRAMVTIDKALAIEVLEDSGIEEDGLTRLMVQYLNGLWGRRRWSKQKQDWIITASLSTMAHVVGRARDKTIVEQEVEPELLKRGYIDVVPGGRTITDLGMDRIGVRHNNPDGTAIASEDAPVEAAS